MWYRLKILLAFVALCNEIALVFFRLSRSQESFGLLSWLQRLTGALRAYHADRGNMPELVVLASILADKYVDASKPVEDPEPLATHDPCTVPQG